jgi:hypothetical protein
MSMSLAHIDPHFAFVYVGLLVAKEEAGLGVTHPQNGGQNHNTQQANKFFKKRSESQPSGERH